jgi:diguanylate cyclase (GGDEF)-like protein/PAS domain S-box-containing protein
MNHAPFVVYMKDDHERLTFYNDRMAERFNISSREWLGKTSEELWPPEIAAEQRRAEQQVVSGGRMVEKVEEITERDGRKACWRTYRFPWWNERGEIMLGAFAIDVTEELEQRKALEAANEKLSRQATIDVLTGLPNRRVLDERVEFEFRFAQRHKTHLSVVMMDLDNFKKVNDQLGHAEGDRVLQEAAKVLRDKMRATDLAARYGGEEFVVLLPGADTDGAILFAERVRAGLRQVKALDKHVTASLGIAALDATTNGGKRLIQRADEAMYEAKRAGKDRIETHRDLLAKAMAELEAGHS